MMIPLYKREREEIRTTCEKTLERQFTTAMKNKLKVEKVERRGKRGNIRL